MSKIIDTGYKKIKKDIQTMAARSMGGVNREETCMYKLHDGSRFCKATTHNKCKYCRFYEPSTHAVFTACYQELERSRALVAIINKYIDQIEGAKNVLLDAADCSLLIKKEADKMASDGFIAKQLWLDSVNTFE